MHELKLVILTLSLLLMVTLIGCTAEADLLPINPTNEALWCNRDDQGNLLSDQWYWFNYQIKTEAKKKMEAIPSWGWPHARAPEAFDAYGEKLPAPLLELPKTKLSASIKRNGNTGVITIKNQSDTPAFMVLIDDFPHKYGNFLGDNSFSLYPNETRKITFELRDSEETLNKLAVRAWNAPQVKIK